MDYQLKLDSLSTTIRCMKDTIHKIQDSQEQVYITNWLLNNVGWDGTAAEAFAVRSEKLDANFSAFFEHASSGLGVLQKLEPEAQEADKKAQAMAGIFDGGGLLGAIGGWFSGVTATVSLDRNSCAALLQQCAAQGAACSQQESDASRLSNMEGQLNSSIPFADLAIRAVSSEAAQNRQRLEELGRELTAYQQAVDAMEAEAASGAAAVDRPEAFSANSQ